MKGYQTELVSSSYSKIMCVCVWTCVYELGIHRNRTIRAFNYLFSDRSAHSKAELIQSRGSKIVSFRQPREDWKLVGQYVPKTDLSRDCTECYCETLG